MVGRRIFPGDDGHLRLAPGDYGRDADGWWCCTPAPTALMGNLNGHEVTENANGTITVSPSILVTYDGADNKVLWHGFLENGVWREV